MKFEEIQYVRADMAGAAQKLEELALSTSKAASGKELLDNFAQYQKIYDTVETAGSMAYVRHTVDTRDEFYDGENNYYDAQNPIVADKQLTLYRALLASPHKGALQEKYGQILLDKMELAVQSSDERLIPLQQEENALGSEYQKLYASAKIPFQGQELTVPQMTPFKQHTDRALRKEAYEAEGGFFESKREQLDEIYDKLVKNRTTQAQMLGYKTFTPVGDIRMERLGYTREEIGACRDAIVRGFVPAATELKALQAKRIGVQDFKFYDDMLSLPGGNPTPKGTPDEILAAGQKMYRELSPETAEFIDLMMDNGLFDVLSKPGKAPGGYCTYLPELKSPFIFSNFNGTAGDVDVLTHEAGHAFQAYLAAKQGYIAELRSPGLESCEIHSMSMEFLTAEYHSLFFGEDTGKYELTHAEEAMYFMPYGCMVDEFQECVYNEPNLTPNQRNELWMDLERKYRPWNDFANLPFYSRGAGWQRQSHIYSRPFYYIDYVLAQAVSLDFFVAHGKDKADAWQRYLALTMKGGTETYKGLVRAAGFEPPFTPGVMERIGGELAAFIRNHPLSGR